MRVRGGRARPPATAVLQVAGTEVDVYLTPLDADPDADLNVVAADAETHPPG